MEKSAAKILLPATVWRDLIKELARRGDGKRESGAFLLSSDIKIKHILFYDDLDPGCLDEGAIHFKARGYVKLWDYCLSNDLRVIADIHTHPSKWTGQSWIDKENPMISEIGHIALIAPYYAQAQAIGFNGIGMYEYHGNYQWRTLSKKQIKLIENE